MASTATIIIFLFFFFFIIFSSSSSVSSVSSSFATVSGTHNVGGSRRFTKIYAFGDSYTDTGNTRSESGPNGFQHVSSPPYGITFFHHPTNRYSDGRLVIDFVTETLSLPYLPPYLDRKADTSHGVNFAVAGSTAIDHDFFVKQNITFRIPIESIQIQLGWFKMFLESHGCHDHHHDHDGINRNKMMMSKECRVLMEDALFWVGEIGANDYAYTIGSSVPGTTIQELGVKRVTGVLQELLDMGAKYVVVQGLPTTGCLALSMTLAPTDDRDEIGCVGSANKRSYSHNAQLQANLQHLRKQYPQALISYADYWNAYRTVMNNTSKYRFKEPFKACCGSGGGPYNFDLFVQCGSPAVPTACKNPAQYINWDGVHLTEAMYKVVADMFIHGGYCHPSFDVLLSTKTLGD